MIRVIIKNPQQFTSTVQAWYADEVKAGTLAGHEYELAIKKRRDSKSRIQEEKYHAMIGDIARQCTLHGKQLPAESWKRLLVDAFKHETKDDPEYAPEWAKFGNIELLPALNHPGFVMVGEQTRRFSIQLASGFITFLLAFGNDQGVKWTPSRADREQYEAMQR